MNNVEKLRKVLEFYASAGAGCRKITSEGEDARNALDRDGGKRALEALALLPEELTDIEYWEKVAKNDQDGNARVTTHLNIQYQLGEIYGYYDWRQKTPSEIGHGNIINSLTREEFAELLISDKVHRK